MMAKVAELEKQLGEIPSAGIYESRIAELEMLLEEFEQQHAEKSARTWIMDILFYLVFPLSLLLLAHWLITVVYDTKMVYLRIISMILPLPFAYALFKEHAHMLFPWFAGIAFLAIGSVIGMSWITSLVDHSPVWPQSLFEWKELLEYSASIAFSFLTGMLLGRMARLNRQKRFKLTVTELAKSLSSEGKVSVDGINGAMKKLQEYGGTIVALGTTAVSIYTGLKGIIGS
jgi:hypothetical protein